jgi:nucleoside 2-deoxyribosyltransferase
MTGLGPKELSVKFNIPRSTIKRILERSNVLLNNKEANRLSGIKKRNIPYKEIVLQNGYKSKKIDGKRYLEHRLVVEKELGRKLKSEEIIHHIDNDKQNNNIENLVVLSNKEHAQLHASYDAIIGKLIKDGTAWFNKEKNIVEYIGPKLYSDSDWDYAKVYLAGPMEKSLDCVSWRKEITEKLVSFGMKKENILDPSNKPKIKGSLSLSDEQKIIKELKEKNDWKELEIFMKKIMRADLKMVDQSDFIIANLSEQVLTVGTIHEIIVARNQKKPVFLIVKDRTNFPSLWLAALIEQEDRVCESLDEVIQKLSIIKNSGPQTARDAREWILFDLGKKDNE